MIAIDVEKLLSPVTEDNPCGDDLEYDPAFQELERAATVNGGGSMLADDDDEAEPPNWREIAEQAETLLGQTKDLRAAVYLTDAKMDTHGVPALSEGVALIKGLLTTYWDEVHPRLDEEDDNDPTMRINSLASLTDANGLVRHLTLIPMVKGQRAGAYSLRDFRIANAEIPAPEGTEPPDLGIINATFKEVELEELESSAAAVSAAIDDLNAIESYLTQQVGAGNNTLTVKPLVDELNAIEKIYAEQLRERGVDVETTGEESEAGGATGQRVSGDITSRDDAIRMLDKISEYFRRNEPSSPVPLLLQRAKGLISKDFMEILRDLTPDAISQAEIYSRPHNED